MGTYSGPLFITAVLVNVLMTVGFFTGAFRFVPLPDPWIAVGIVGVVVSVAQLAGAVRAGNTAARWLAGIGAVISGIGWGSWLVVGLTADPGDPVINVTGLLIVPGALFSLIALVVLLVGTRMDRFTSTGRTYTGAFASVAVLLLLAKAAVRLYSIRAMDQFGPQIYSEEVTTPDPFAVLMWAGLGLTVIAVAVGIIQIITAIRSGAPEQARMSSGIAGALLIVGSLLLAMFLWPLSVVLSVAAVVVERRAGKTQ